MVYESDFYTTRRPYTRPISSHYTITAMNKLPHTIPYIGHKRLVHVIHTPYPVVHYTHQVPVPIRIYSRVRPSVIAAELHRIRDLPRTSSVSYVSRYLNSRDNILFDDEAREIRARADSLLRKIHVFVPRPLSSDFAEVIVPERMRSDDYIRRLLSGRNSAKKEDESSSNWYDSSAHRDFGTGHLAAVSYTAGKPHSRRRPYYKVADLRAADVQSDVNLLSYYAKNRQAAASALLQRKLDEDELRRQVAELKRQAEEEKRRQAEEARLAEERWKAEIEERERLEREARAARLREIEEQERLEDERRKEEERIEAEKIRDTRIAEEQRRAAELEAIIAQEEEERFSIEKASDEARKRQDIEEKLAEIALNGTEDFNRPDSTTDECHCHDNYKFQEREERPESPDADDDTHIEEEAACLSTDHDDLSESNHYDGEHQGFNSVPVLDAPIDNTPKVEELSSDDDEDA